MDLTLLQLKRDIIVGDNTGEPLGDVKHFDCVWILQALPPPIFDTELLYYMRLGISNKFFRFRP
jgi:hypothetical protein